jgi:hypothetical protein
MDEMASLNERLDSNVELVEHLREQIRMERALRHEQSRALAETRGLVDGLVAEVGRLHDQLVRVTMLSGQRMTPLAEGGPVRNAGMRTLTPYQGRLVPIGEPIEIESDDEDEVVLDSEEEGTGGEVVDLAEEEEEQAREAARGGVETLHAEIVRNRDDPAPEYTAPPDYNN